MPGTLLNTDDSVVSKMHTFYSPRTNVPQMSITHTHTHTKSYNIYTHRVITCTCTHTHTDTRRVISYNFCEGIV